MTFIRFLEFLLLLIVHQVYSEDIEPVFKAEGGSIMMGFCFGADYIAVYRSGPEGDQLLGNSSADNAPTTLPPDVQGRISFNKHHHLLGMLISNLTHVDSGIYRRECWLNHTLVSQQTNHLSVCGQEVESEEIIADEEGGGAELLCNSTSLGLEGTSVRWYSEMYPSYKPTVFVDSSVSLDPLVKEMQGVVEVRGGGALLFLDNSLLKNNNHFYCVVMKGKDCLNFQSMYLTDYSESRDICASQGDRVVLNCPSDGEDQQWETPLGRINGSSVKNNQMFISLEKEDFSLVIPELSDELSGDYSCISSSFEMQYTLFLCPKKKSQKKDYFEGSNVLLNCDFGKDDFKWVQWHRGDPSGDYELIHDSLDETIPIPVDLRGRLTPSKNGSLTISHLLAQDQGVYWCVVLQNPVLLEEGDDYEGDYDEEDSVEDEFTYNRCISKQETILNLIKATPGLNRTYDPTSDSPTADPNVAAPAVGAAVVGLLVVGAIVTVIAVKRRRTKASQNQRDTANEINMKEDPGCTERLTHNDDCGA